jgi:hypothetical protein
MRYRNPLQTMKFQRTFTSLAESSLAGSIPKIPLQRDSLNAQFALYIRVVILNLTLYRLWCCDSKGFYTPVNAVLHVFWLSFFPSSSFLLGERRTALQAIVTSQSLYCMSCTLRTNTLLLLVFPLCSLLVSTTLHHSKERLHSTYTIRIII